MKEICSTEKLKGAKQMWIKSNRYPVFNRIKEILHRAVLKIKYMEMDNWWYLYGSCWQLFPPSFY
jgi:hypothetical protein